MRNSRVMALAIATLVSSATLVQAQAGAGTDRAPRAGRAMGRGIEGRPGAGGLFRGVKLSDAEKAKIKSIREKYRAQGQELRKAQRPVMEEIRNLRQKGDTAGARAAFERTRGDREKFRAQMEQERNEIRGALSAENQKAFDANLKRLDERRAEFAKGRRDREGGDAKGGKGARAGHGRRGPRATNG